MKTTYLDNVFICSVKSLFSSSLPSGMSIFTGADSIKLHKYDDLIAYPTFCAALIPALVIPTKFPLLSNRGPPLLPG